MKNMIKNLIKQSGEFDFLYWPTGGVEKNKGYWPTDGGQKKLEDDTDGIFK